MSERKEEMGVASTGSGPPVIVLPGLSRREEIRSATAYRPLAAVTHRTVSVVARPRGLQRNISMEDLAAKQLAVLREHFTEPFDLMGISTGGAIALQLAVDHPSAVRRLIVVAAASWFGSAGRLKLRQYG